MSQQFNKLRFWNKETGEKIYSYQLPYNNNISFFKDDKQFLVAGISIKIWKYSENKIVIFTTYRPHGNINELLLFDNEQFLVYIINQYLKMNPLSICNLNQIIPRLKKQATKNGYRMVLRFLLIMCI
ncbi:unnamed protein product [Paramecium pentaurelia]|uniref:Uncharacterized protein n=1 Tax=Paramecium pentaurelia TaxID=43138 RepID=A0A8S1XGV9_9CILI|nr:unnamed protein product [Paramecium pentaurelia]